jgi:hypothetical protein
VTSKPTGIQCRSCTEIRPADHFYESATECVTCKKERSRQARLIAARKIALAERVIDLLAEVASRGWRPDLWTQERGSAGDATASLNPSTEPQEVQP